MVETFVEKKKEAFQPTQLHERVTTLDVIRGISLLGILLVNIFAFYLPLPHIDLGSWFSDAIDKIWHQTLDIYVQSSFYPMFSMLFGYGIAMQYTKAQNLGTNYYKYGSRRLIVLFIIGLIHAFFIWWGDILMMYAVCGAFLLLFLQFNGGILLTFSIVMNCLFHLFFIGVILLSGIAMEPYEFFVDIEMLDKALTAYGTGSWMDAFFQRLHDLKVQMALSSWLSALFTILPYMMLGAAASKWKLIERAKQLKLFWLCLAIFCVGLGVFMKSAPYLFERTTLFEIAKVYIGGPILSIGYISVIVLLCIFPVVTKLLKPIANAGRMALTLYIMQSIICSIIFYHFGFGLYGKVDVKTATFIAIGIFVLQVAFAELWFIKFKQGPLEWGTKKIIYKKFSGK